MISVVVVDDDPDWRSVLCLMLGAYPELNLLAEGSDGQEAVELCQTHQPDVLLLDIDMPKMSGLEVAKELQALSATPYLVFQTGRQEHALEAFQLEASDYLVKPVDQEKLDVCVERMVTRVSALKKAQQADDLADKVAELEETSNTDPMVGAYNRRYMDARLELAISKAEVGPEPLGCIMLDMDYFKKVNDNHGHATGDLVLVQLCDLIKENLRGHDTLARYGGEEFLLLLHEADPAESCRVAERIRSRVEQKPFGDPSQKLALSVSLGVTTYKKGDTASVLVDRADKALYEAKSGGRNRFVYL